MKTLGIIGGLGRLAAPLLLERVAEISPEPVPVTVCDFPAIPDRTGYILGSNLRSPLPGLLWAGRTLARQGVCCVAIPSVSACWFYEELTEGICAPVLNPVTAAAEHLRREGVATAGIMTTEGTLRSGILSRALTEAGIRPLIPGAREQARLDHLIRRNIKAGAPPEMDRFFGAEEALRHAGAEVIVLACPELSALGEREDIGKGFLDVLRVLAAEAVTQCTGIAPRELIR